MKQHTINQEHNHYLQRKELKQTKADGHSSKIQLQKCTRQEQLHDNYIQRKQLQSQKQKELKLKKRVPKKKKEQNSATNHQTHSDGIIEQPKSNKRKLIII